jgi:nucleotide-binding universal stress UspA family protein
MAETGSSSASASSPSGDTEVVGTPGAVVVAVDGTEADGPVVDWASDEATRLRSPLRVVTVIDAGVQMTSYEVLASESPRVEEVLREEVHPVLDAAAARARARHPTLDIAVSAPLETAAGALVRLSDGALRVVVGGPAKGHLEHMLFGSVALPVVAHAHCPVVVVPAGADISTPRRIVVGVDGSDASRHAVEFALRTAEMCGAAVTAVLVWHVEVEGGVVVTERSSERWAAVEHRYESLGHRVTDPASDRHPGVEVDIKVLHGSPAKTLVEVGHGADLMVVGGRRRGGFRGLLLGSVSRRVVEHAPCAVAVVH